MPNGVAQNVRNQSLAMKDRLFLGNGHGILRWFQSLPHQDFADGGPFVGVAQGRCFCG
jgi:hypothetical protein